MTGPHLQIIGLVAHVIDPTRKDGIYYGANITWLATLAHNLAIVGGMALMFRAGDNFGFHMGSDESQCTCQWSPGRGVPYEGATRCGKEAP